MKSNTIILATRNKGKIAELGALLAPFKLTVIGLDSFPDIEEVDETGTTFEENALLKACTVSRLSGLVAIADDSGMEVDYLNKEPGVYSARYSATPQAPATDQKNLELVLQKLQGVPMEKRSGRFVCCMAACTPAGEHMTSQRSWEGVLAEKPMGNNGFGYDPIFFLPEHNCTAAQMSKEKKNTLSHRSMAVQGLLEQWPAFWKKWLQDLEG